VRVRRRQQQQQPPPRHAKTRAGRLSTPAWPPAQHDALMCERRRKLHAAAAAAAAAAGDGGARGGTHGYLRCLLAESGEQTKRRRRASLQAVHDTGSTHANVNDARQKQTRSRPTRLLLLLQLPL